MHHHTQPNPGPRLHQAARIAARVAARQGLPLPAQLRVRLQVLGALEADAGLRSPAGCALIRRLLAHRALPRHAAPCGALYTPAAPRPTAPHTPAAHCAA